VYHYLGPVAFLEKKKEFFPPEECHEREGCCQKAVLEGLEYSGVQKKGVLSKNLSDCPSLSRGEM